MKFKDTKCFVCKEEKATLKMALEPTNQMFSLCDVLAVSSKNMQHCCPEEALAGALPTTQYKDCSGQLFGALNGNCQPTFYVGCKVGAPTSKHVIYVLDQP